MVEYATIRQSAVHLEQPKNFNFEPFIRGLKSNIFDWDQIRFRGGGGGGGGGPTPNGKCEKNLFFCDLSHNIFFPFDSIETSDQNSTKLEGTR